MKIFISIYFFLSIAGTFYSVDQPTALQVDNTTKYALTFYSYFASTTSPGHVWVGFREGKSEERWGFYKGKGFTQDKGMPEADYTFTVSEENYRRAYRVIAHYHTQSYRLGSNDCRHFAAAVAKAAGLKVPRIGSSQSPPAWMAELVDLN